MHGYIPDVCIFVLYHLCKWNVPTFWVILLHLIINMSALPKFWDAFNFHSYSCIIILVQSYLFLKCFSERIWRNSLMKNIISIQKDEKKKMHLIAFQNGVFCSQPQGKKKKKEKSMKISSKFWYPELYIDFWFWDVIFDVITEQALNFLSLKRHIVSNVYWNSSFAPEHNWNSIMQSILEESGEMAA